MEMENHIKKCDCAWKVVCLQYAMRHVSRIEKKALSKLRKEMSLDDEAYEQK